MAAIAPLPMSVSQEPESAVSGHPSRSAVARFRLPETQAPCAAIQIIPGSYSKGPPGRPGLLQHVVDSGYYQYCNIVVIIEETARLIM